MRRKGLKKLKTLQRKGLDLIQKQTNSIILPLRNRSFPRKLNKSSLKAPPNLIQVSNLLSTGNFKTLPERKAAWNLSLSWKTLKWLLKILYRNLKRNQLQMELIPMLKTPRKLRKLKIRLQNWGKNNLSNTRKGWLKRLLERVLWRLNRMT